MDAINLEQKTISIKHKVIEDTVDGKSIAVGEDVLKTKSSLECCGGNHAQIGGDLK